METEQRKSSILIVYHKHWLRQSKATKLEGAAHANPPFQSYVFALILRKGRSPEEKMPKEHNFRSLCSFEVKFKEKHINFAPVIILPQRVHKAGFDII